MKKILLSLTALMIYSTAFAQLTYRYYDEKVEQWHKSIYKDNLTNGAKEKTIDFPQFHYCITGSFTKGILTDGQTVRIYATESDPFLVLEGKVSYLANRLVVKGVKYTYDGKHTTKTYGSFYVSNCADNTMIYKPKKAGELCIADSEIEYFKGFYLDCPTIVCVSLNPYIAVDGKTGGRGYIEYAAPLQQLKISEIGYDRPYDLLLTTKDNAIMNWDSGLSFRGAVIPKITDEGLITFTLLSGEKTGFSQGYRTIKVIEDGNKIRMQLENDPKNTTLYEETIYVADKSLIPLESYWDMSMFYNNMEHIAWKYQNGDMYEGKAKCEIKMSDDKEQTSYSTTLTDGNYTYSNGDSFEGNLSGDTFYGMFISGTTHFKNGDSKKGNWLSEYNLTPAQYSKLSSYRYPSIIRDSAVVFNNNNLYDGYISAAKKAEYGKKYAEAKKYFLAAKEIKPTAEKWDEKIKELDKKIEHEELRRRLMSKYGSVVGNKLAEDKFEIGMTKEMIVDAWANRQALLHAYRVSNSTDWNNNVVEIWEYDYSMVQKYMQKELGSEAAGIFNLLSAFGATQGINIRSEISKDTKYKYFKFKNGKLVEIKDSSIYDDIDNAADDFSRSLLFGF